MKYIPLNWNIIANPYNWVIIFLIMSLGAMLLHVLMPASGATPEDDSGVTGATKLATNGTM